MPMARWLAEFKRDELWWQTSGKTMAKYNTSIMEVCHDLGQKEKKNTALGLKTKAYQSNCRKETSQRFI